MMKEEQNHPCDVLYPNPQPQSYHEKTLDRSNLMDIFLKPGHYYLGFKFMKEREVQNVTDEKN